MNKTKTKENSSPWDIICRGSGKINIVTGSDIEGIELLRDEMMGNFLGSAHFLGSGGPGRRHYSEWGKMCQSLLDAPYRSLVTTQSLEFIQALYRYADKYGDTELLKFYRLQKHGDETKVVAYSDEQLRNAVELGAEMR